MLRIVLVRLAMRWPRQSFAIANLLDRLSAELGRADRTFWRRGVSYIGIFHPSERWPYPALTTGPDPATMRPPMVLASFHIGAMQTIGALLERLPAEVLAFVYREFPPGRGVITRESVEGSEWQRAAAMKRAIQTLRSGGFVFIALDGGQANARVRATVLGEPVSWSRGGFELARLTGSPIVPVISRWRGRKIEIVAGEPISPGETEVTAARLAAWLDGYLDRNRDLVGQVRR